MAENTSIEWTDATFNPWRGCTKVATECAHCYAEKLAKRNPSTLGAWGPNGTRVVAAESYWRQPLKWQRQPILTCVECGRSVKGESTKYPDEATYDFECSSCHATQYTKRRPRVFCASLADVFEDWAGPMVSADGTGLAITDEGASTIRPMTLHDVRRRLFSRIDATPYLDWLLLTKRPENIREMWQSVMWQSTGRRNNVWLGTTCGHPDSIQRVADLVKCSDLAPVLFVSCEPMLGRVDFCDHDGGRLRQHGNFLTGGYWSEMWDGGGGMVTASRRRIDQLIIGCESNGQKVGSLGDFTSEADWIEYAIHLVQQCQAAGVAAFVKQIPLNGRVSHNPTDWPAPLRVREFPTNGGDQ